MLNPFKPPELIKAETFMSMPEKFRGPDRRTLYITDSLNGEILTARLPVAGKPMYGLAP
jgi:hypothetical protein